MVAAIDLELDDLIHIGTQGLKRLGRRLAAVALGAPTLDLSRVSWADPTRLRVEFSGVRGGLRAPGKPTGFSLWDANGQEVALLYKVTLDGDAAILHLTDLHGPIPRGMHLYYGYGLNPHVNVTDAEDSAVPAFGPFPVPDQENIA
jgi:sialate O-acetylesterase